MMISQRYEKLLEERFLSDERSDQGAVLCGLTNAVLVCAADVCGYKWAVQDTAIIAGVIRGRKC